MKIFQFVKQLNNTELGKGGTHDSYVLVPTEFDISELFDQIDVPIRFTDTDSYSGDEEELRHTVGREKRIVGLGPYYRKRELSAGDEITLIRKQGKDFDSFFISSKRYDDVLVFKRLKDGFELLTPERYEKALIDGKIDNSKLKVEYLDTIKRRNDSPDETTIYTVLIDGKDISNDYSSKTLCMLQIKDEGVSIKKYYGCKMYCVED